VCPLRCAADHSQERARSLRSLCNRIRRSGTLSAYPVRLVSGSTACGSGVPILMAKKSYAELLKDPRWQRRRLEILERGDFSCELCEATDRTLHVHHKLYRKGAMPWEYADHELRALCEDCHSQLHHLRARLDEAIAYVSDCDMEVLLGFAEALAARAECEERIPIRSAEHAMGVSACFWPHDEMSVISILNPVEGGEHATVDLEALWELNAKRRALLQG
jgi:5-methylcytosine-specific restriction endonuclease McrA